jgi:hypothetical protein
MAANLAGMMWFRAKADKLLLQGDTVKAKANLARIGNLMVPVNIALGVGAIYLGVFLRNAY